MKKIIFVLFLTVSIIALPASADERYPRFVIWGARSDIYAGPKLAGTARRGVISTGSAVALWGRSASGSCNVRVGGADGWAGASPFAEATLAVCTGDNVNVRSAPKTGQAIKNCQLFKGDSVLVTGRKQLGEKHDWYRIYMIGSEERWVYGKYLTLSLPIEESAAAELRFLCDAAKNSADTNVEGLQFTGLKRGGNADLALESMGLLRGAGWIGPMELKEGDNRYTNSLRITPKRAPSVLCVTVTNGGISGIRFEGQAAGRAADKTYINERFGFAVSVPGYLQMLPGPQNDDGRIFTDAWSGLRITASGINNVLMTDAIGDAKMSVPEGVKSFVKSDPAKAGQDVTLRWDEGNDVVWHRVILVTTPENTDGVLISVHARYPKADEKKCLGAVLSTLKSLHPTGK